jgi:hypothetical protein
MIIDNVHNQYDMKIIDICCMQDLEGLELRDEGYIKGISNIIRILEMIET